jgi:hypothetical protein
MVAALKLVPQWTKKVTFEAGGREPLGLNKLSDFLKNQLLSGIVTNNNRARYYSYFCWALWHMDREDPAKGFRNFVTKWRRREAVLALATLSNNPLTSPIGVEMAAPKLARGKERGEVDCDFLVLGSSDLGAFKRYFRGSLYELGLTQRTADGVYHVTPEGEGLALTLHHALEKTPYVRKQLFKEPVIPLTDLEKSSQFLTLDAVREPPAARERKVLTEAFFKFRGKKVTKRDELRRRTLALILHVLSEYERHGALALVGHADDHIVFPAYYYDVLWISKGRVASYRCPEPLLSVHSLWKQFCQHQYFTRAAEHLLQCVLEAIGAEVSGLSLDEVVGRILGQNFYESLRELSGVRCKVPRDLFQALGIEGVPDKAMSSRLRKQHTLLAPSSEFSLSVVPERRSPPKMAARALTTLSVLYGKWRGARDDQGFSRVSAQAGPGFWLGSVIPLFDNWVRVGATWPQVMRTLVDVVLSQHYRVMRERRKPDSIWVHLDGDRVIKEHDYQATPRTTRHLNAVNILLDLLLIEADADQRLRVTKQGQRVLKEVLA